ncbi:MAG: hypothetical protein AAF415_03920 [Pseudomonadota bacterium]
MTVLALHSLAIIPALAFLLTTDGVSWSSRIQAEGIWVLLLPIYVVWLYGLTLTAIPATVVAGAIALLTVARRPLRLWPDTFAIVCVGTVMGSGASAIALGFGAWPFLLLGMSGGALSSLVVSLVWVRLGR